MKRVIQIYRFVFLVAVLTYLVVASVTAWSWFTRPYFSPREMHEKLILFLEDPTQADLLEDIAAMADHPCDFDRRYAVGTLGTIGSQYELSDEHLSLIYKGCFSGDAWDISASTRALYRIMPLELPKTVSTRMLKNIIENPGNCSSFKAVMVLFRVDRDALVSNDKIRELIRTNQLCQSESLDLHPVREAMGLPVISDDTP